MWNNSELKEKAKASYRPNYWLTVLAGVIITIFAAASGGSSGRSDHGNNLHLSSGGFAGILALSLAFTAISFALIIAIVKIIVGNSLIVGAQKVLINNSYGIKSEFSTFVFVFKDGHWKNVAINMFLRSLFTALWTLLFIIPGIVKSYEYAMIPYLLAENPEMTYDEVFKTSKEMMNGNKFNTFCLDLSFIGWFLLDVLTFGILGVFYVHPYYFQTRAELFITLKANR